ncbi:hypothetical protein KJ996_06570, partial [Patescibacteria group bacterium]|nr:hypothetical protein [Patescibacteria group bacterium]
KLLPLGFEECLVTLRPAALSAKMLRKIVTSDGVYWWIMWYISVLITALPLIILGVFICTLVGWIKRRKQ